jgi:hypothetical protein
MESQQQLPETLATARVSISHTAEGKRPTTLRQLQQQMEQQQQLLETLALARMSISHTAKGERPPPLQQVQL